MFQVFKCFKRICPADSGNDYHGKLGHHIEISQCNMLLVTDCLLSLHSVNKSSCGNLNMEARKDGVCYNGTKPYGFWDEELASENGQNPGCPAIEYFK